MVPIFAKNQKPKSCLLFVGVFEIEIEIRLLLAGCWHVVQDVVRRVCVGGERTRDLLLHLSFVMIAPGLCP
jgi:hypothetical protein